MSERDDDNAIFGSGVVEIRVAARAELIATVRAVASEIATRAGLDFDGVADVRMAVDEACTQLASHTDPDQWIRVRFEVDHHRCMRVTLTTRTTAAHPGIDRSGFGWRVLAVLTDELDTETDAGPHRDEIIMRLTKKRHPISTGF